MERLEGGSLSLIIDDPTSPGVTEDLAGKLAVRLQNFRPRISAANPRLINTFLGFNHRHQCRTQVFRRSADPEPLIDFAEAAPPITADLIEEITSFFGVLERVGGATPKAWLRLDNGDRVICRLPLDRILAQELAHHLYKEVGLSGRAIRDLRSEELVELFVEELTYTQTPVTESFRQLECGLGRYWSDVDVMSVIREERGEIGELPQEPVSRL
ncbi:hypothetical protein BH20VER3_BH20VER3_06080 [soil metagenome]